MKSFKRGNLDLVLLPLCDHLDLLVHLLNTIYHWQPGMDLKYSYVLSISKYIVLFTIRL